MSQRSYTGFPLAIVTLAVFVQSAHSAEPLRRTKSATRTITQPKFDPDAERVELFDGLEEGVFATKVIAMGPQRGKILITNNTGEPLTVELPDAFVAVHVLKQFQPGGNGPGGGNIFSALQQQGGPQQQQQGGQQSVGGGIQQQNGPGNGQNLFGNGNGNGNGNNNPGGGGAGFFSIPPEATVGVSYVSACLDHGKPNPTPQASYVLMRVEDYTQDRVLQELIALVGSGKYHRQAAQAAVWNRSDSLSWEELAAKYSYSVVGKVPYFTDGALQTARKLSAQAVVRAGDRKQNSAAAQAVAAIKRP